jgi:adenosylcobinamide-phosphate synthase
MIIAWPALVGAYVLDLLAGDPRFLPHPVVLVGRLVRTLEGTAGRFARTPTSQLVAGVLIVAAVVGATSAAGWLLLESVAGFSPAAEQLVVVILGWTTLATRSLLEHGTTVTRALDAGDVAQARQQVARMVGRDTQGLDEPGVARAVVETVAESSCDGVVAPLFYLTIGGPILALAYKAVNTLDSMIGHRDPPYLYLGRAAARLDDLANLVPSRLTAVAICLSAFVTGRSGRSAWRIWRRDGGKHDSPNAGQPEAAMAGALGVRLGGTNRYDGQPVERPLLGVEFPPPDRRDARAALQLAGIVSVAGFLAALAASVLGATR